MILLFFILSLPAMTLAPQPSFIQSMKESRDFHLGEWEKVGPATQLTFFPVIHNNRTGTKTVSTTPFEHHNNYQHLGKLKRTLIEWEETAKKHHVFNHTVYQEALNVFSCVESQTYQAFVTMYEGKIIAVSIVSPVSIVSSYEIEYLLSDPNYQLPPHIRPQITIQNAAKSNIMATVRFLENEGTDTNITCTSAHPATSICLAHAGFKPTADYTGRPRYRALLSKLKHRVEQAFHDHTARNDNTTLESLIKTIEDVRLELTPIKQHFNVAIGAYIRALDDWLTHYWKPYIQHEKERLQRKAASIAFTSPHKDFLEKVSQENRERLLHYAKGCDISTFIMWCYGLSEGRRVLGLKDDLENYFTPNHYQVKVSQAILAAPDSSHDFQLEKWDIVAIGDLRENKECSVTSLLDQPLQVLGSNGVRSIEVRVKGETKVVTNFHRALVRNSNEIIEKKSGPEPFLRHSTIPSLVYESTEEPAVVTVFKASPTMQALYDEHVNEIDFLFSEPVQWMYKRWAEWWNYTLAPRGKKQEKRDNFHDYINKLLQEVPIPMPSPLPSPSTVTACA